MSSLPAQEIDLPTFSIAKYPVTYLQYQAFINAEDGFVNDAWWQGLAHRPPADQEQRFKLANHPRDTVSWVDSMAFCRWLSSKFRYAITLPTEQQWEKAARGTDGRYFPWGSMYQSGYANINETYKEQNVGKYYLQTTTAVGIYPQAQSPYQVLDLIGNVWEWTLTEFENSSGNNMNNRTGRILRGGSWLSHRFLAHAAFRNGYFPYDWFSGFGFRVVAN